jgi:RNA recognition motif-containing protein
VEFRSREDIKDAIRKLDGVEIRGNAIYVREVGKLD